jgi:hypothetical protein
MLIHLWCSRELAKTETSDRHATVRIIKFCCKCTENVYLFDNILVLVLHNYAKMLVICLCFKANCIHLLSIDILISDFKAALKYESLWIIIPGFLWYIVWKIANSWNQQPNEPLKIPWLIDCYRGFYYLVHWRLWWPIVGKPINQLV